MPKTDEWDYGDFAEVVAPITWTTPPKTDDPPPKVGDVGTVVTINTVGGVATSIGVEFGKRSWVIPVEFLVCE